MTAFSAQIDSRELTLEIANLPIAYLRLTPIDGHYIARFGNRAAEPRPVFHHAFAFLEQVAAPVAAPYQAILAVIGSWLYWRV